MLLGVIRKSLNTGMSYLPNKNARLAKTNRGFLFFLTAVVTNTVSALGQAGWFANGNGE